MLSHIIMKQYNREKITFNRVFEFRISLISKWYALILILLISSYTSWGQENSDAIPANLNFFLECEDCDFNFVRQELKSISFVRNPDLADVHIMSTESGTGSGGRKYYLQFIGANQFAGKLTEYIYLSEQSETDDEIRKGLLKLIKTGVLHYYSIAGLELNAEINFNDETINPDSFMNYDPWNKWIFNIEVGGDFEKEESQKELGYNLGGSVKKITIDWKTNFDFNINNNVETFIDDEEEIKNEQKKIQVSSNFIKSLSPHWSFGAFTDYYSDTYLNTKNNLGARIGIEYNIFPWELSDRKIFTFRYSTGSKYKQYFKETIYNKMNEMLWFEAVEIKFEIIQPWGEIETSIEGLHYFQDFSKNKINFETDISIRLSKQLSVYFEFQADVIHDQFYLIKDEGASLEDLLLERRKLATAYEFGGKIGFRFTFGSIYNNVVNERF